MVSLNPVRILKNEADEEKAEVKRNKNKISEKKSKQNSIFLLKKSNKYF